MFGSWWQRTIRLRYFGSSPPLGMNKLCDGSHKHATPLFVRAKIAKSRKLTVALEELSYPIEYCVATAKAVKRNFTSQDLCFTLDELARGLYAMSTMCNRRDAGIENSKGERIGSGKQPCALSKLLIQEFKSFGQIKVRGDQVDLINKMVKSKSLSCKYFKLKKGCKILNVSLEHVGMGRNVCSRTVVDYGVFLDPGSHVKAALNLSHPFDKIIIPPHAVSAITGYFAVGIEELAEKMKSCIEKWRLWKERHAVDVSSYPESVQPYALKKSADLFAEMLIESGFPKGAAEHCRKGLTSGCNGFGPLEQTGVFPERRRVATTSIDDLLDSAAVRRSLAKPPAYDDIEGLKAVYRST